MTDLAPGLGRPAGPRHVSPDALLAALQDGAGGAVDGASAGAIGDAPGVAGLTSARADAVVSAWTGARLHAGLPGLLTVTDADLGLLVGDWCFAYALQALAGDEDLEAIATLAQAIGDCAVLLTEPTQPGRLEGIWQSTSDALCARS